MYKRRTDWSVGAFLPVSLLDNKLIYQLEINTRFRRLSRPFNFFINSLDRFFNAYAGLFGGIPVS